MFQFQEELALHHVNFTFWGSLSSVGVGISVYALGLTFPHVVPVVCQVIILPCQFCVKIFGARGPKNRLN